MLTQRHKAFQLSSLKERRSLLLYLTALHFAGDESCAKMVHLRGDEHVCYPDNGDLSVATYPSPTFKTMSPG